MKIALLTDTHAGCRNDSVVFNNYFLKFYSDIFFPYLKENGIDTIIHLGDVFDRRKYINFSTLHSWRRNVFEILNRDYKTIIIQGNHDLYYKDTSEVNSLDELLSCYENVHIICEPISMEFDGTDILLIPWINRNNENDCTNMIQTTKSQIVFGHFDIVGFEMYKGLPNHGFGFDSKIFERFDIVASGHYHHKSSNNNVHYLGAPYEMVWSDFDDPKGFHVFDTETRDFQFIMNPLHIFSKLYYDDTGKTYENISKVGFKNFKDCYVKIVIQKKINQILFDQFLELLYKENPFDVSIVESSNELTEDGKIDETKDTLTLIVDYIDELNIIDENKKPLIDLLKSLYLESQDIDVR